MNVEKAAAVFQAMDQSTENKSVYKKSLSIYDNDDDNDDDN